MKTQIKIILLLVCALGAVSGVLMFAKTQLAPPTKLQSQDQYAPALAKAAGELASVTDVDTCTAKYYALDDKIKRYRAEDVVNDETADRNRRVLDSIYGVRLLDDAKAFYGNSVWPTAQMRSMLARLDRLNGDRLSDGRQAVTQTFSDGVAKCHRIASDYNSAWDVARSCNFRSVEDSRSKIDKANTYATAEYLSNVTALTDALNQVQSKLERSHYNTLVYKVNRLEEYRLLTPEQYVSYFEIAVNAINEYKNTNVYGSEKRSVSDLEMRAGNLDEAAAYYYQNNN